ncbi:MAG: DUF2953 domain-containing protein [Lachnospiraceae bacterium]|nr:DUF2953 domain-containing protein [Lachnospiraceae bacterium]
MLTVILTILKILGIIIAVVVGLLLLIVLLVGFVPVRYKAAVKYPEEGTLNEDVISRRKRDALMNKIKGSDEKEESGEAEEEEKKQLLIKANAVVSWLLHIVHVTVDVDSTGMIINARLFGLFKIYSTDPEFVKKKEEKAKKKEEKRRKKEEKQKQKDAAKKKDGKDSGAEEKDKEVKESSEAKEDNKPVITSEDEKNGKGEKTDKDEDTTDDTDDTDIKEPEEGSGKYKGIKGKFLKIKEKIISIKNKISSLNKKKNYIMDMKDNERVRNGVSYAKDKFLLILKRILPKKLNGYVAFGMEDPASTGKILGTVSAFFPIWGGHVTVVPDFDNKRLEVDADLKGRIMLGLLVIPALKVWFNKDIKYIRKKVGKLRKM